MACLKIINKKRGENIYIKQVYMTLKAFNLLQAIEEIKPFIQSRQVCADSLCNDSGDRTWFGALARRGRFTFDTPLIWVIIGWRFCWSKNRRKPLLQDFESKCIGRLIGVRFKSPKLLKCHPTVQSRSAKLHPALESPSSSISSSVAYLLWLQPVLELQS